MLVLLLCFAAGFVLWGLWCAWRAKQSQTWPSVEGRIVKSSVQGDSDENVKLRLKYEYKVGDRPFQGQRVAFGGSPAFDEDSAHIALSLRREGSDVRVYYDPKRPAVSTLDRTAPHAKRDMIWGAIIVIIAFGSEILADLGLLGSD